MRFFALRAKNDKSARGDKNIRNDSEHRELQENCIKIFLIVV